LKFPGAPSIKLHRAANRHQGGLLSGKRREIEIIAGKDVKKRKSFLADTRLNYYIEPRMFLTAQTIPGILPAISNR
jgi:hypothetical protein